MANYELVNADQLDSDLTAVGNAIRSKGGTSAKLSFPSGMVSAIDAISTGVELNFDVVPGLTQPSTVSENAIWVKTKKIGAWYFSATQPEEMQEWDVWFQTGTESNVEFNALRKNAVQVYPLTAKQMVSGVLVNLETKSYWSGEWVYWWNGELYAHGNEFEFKTGGWKVVKEGGGGSFKNNGAELRITGGGTGNGVMAITADKVDLTNFNTVNFSISTATSASASSDEHMLILETSSWSGYTGAAAKAIQNGATGVQSIDVSSLTGKYYVAFNTYGTTKSTIGFNKIWME